MKNNKKNILFVGPFPPHQRGGGENAAYSLATAMKKRGFNVFVLSMGRDKFFEKYNDNGIKFYRIDKYYKGRKDKFSLFHILRYLTIEVFNPFIFLFTLYIILRHRIHVVHLSTLHQISPSPLIAAKLLQRKTLITFHSHELFCFISSLTLDCYKAKKNRCGECLLNVHKFPNILKKNKIFKNIAIELADCLINSVLSIRQSLTSLADYVLFPSNYLKNFYVKYGIEEREARVVYNFLDNIKNDKKRTKKIKKMLGLKNEKVILFVGNMIWAKGPNILLDAFNLLKKKKNLKLIFAGDGHYLEGSKRRVSELKLDGYVIFTGWVSRKDLMSIYNLSDVVVIPSLFPETFSLIFLEAFSAGKIVIASDIGALSENIKDGKNGFLVKPNDSKELAKKLDYVITNLKKLKPISQRAYEVAKSKYDTKIISKEYEGLYS